MAIRDDGYYWVLLNTKEDPIWAVAEWSGSYWLVTGDEMPWEESDVLENGERLYRGN